jgi:hypothetical protein
MDAQTRALLALLFEARRLENQTVRNSDEVDRWHSAVDLVLRESGEQEFQDPKAELNAPHRVAHREWVRNIFTRG